MKIKEDKQIKNFISLNLVVYTTINYINILNMFSIQNFKLENLTKNKANNTKGRKNEL